MNDKIKMTFRTNPELKEKIENESGKLGISQNDYINLAVASMDLKKAGLGNTNGVK